MIVNADEDFHIARATSKRSQSRMLTSRRDAEIQRNQVTAGPFLPPLELVRVVSKAGLGLGDEKVQKRFRKSEAIYQPCH